MIIRAERKTTGFLSMLKGIGVIIFALMALDFILDSNIIRHSIDSLLTVVDSTPSERIVSSRVDR